MPVLRIFAAVILVAPAASIAQQPTRSDSMPHGGQWGAEAVVAPATVGASVVRFQSRTFAWLLGAGFSATRTSTKADDPDFGTDFESSTVGMSARLGVRWYARPNAGKVRPVLGLGALGQITRVRDVSPAKMGGGYGELGAVYFVTPHVSLGGLVEVDATRTKNARLTALGTEVSSHTNAISASLPRVIVSVYF